MSTAVRQVTPLNAAADGRSAHGSRDDARFDALVRAHYAGLCEFAYRTVGSRDAAEDVVQDVLIGIWERADRFDYRDPLPYLYQAVRNRAVSHLRRARVRDHWRARAAAEGTAGAAAPSAGDGGAELAAAVVAAVEALPARRRTIFRMSRDQGLSYPAIAAALGISVKTVETQMGRALRALRTRLAPFLAAALMLAVVRALHAASG
jgi:RNA polymerase sigma-70 factor (ECF subfamily)